MSSIGIPSAFVSGLPMGSKAEYVYDYPKRGLNVVRRQLILNPLDNTWNSDQSGPIRFRLPSDKPVDYRRGYLQFTITVNATGGTYKRLCYGSWSIIDRYRHKSSGSHCDFADRRDYYNRSYSAIWVACQPNTIVDTLGQDLLGCNSPSERDIYGADPQGTQYVLPLDMGLLNSGVMPSNTWGASGHEIEFYLAPANQIIETDGANASYTISNVNWYCEAVQSVGGTAEGGSYEAGLVDLVAKGGLSVWYNSIDMITNVAIQASQEVIISNRNMAVNWVLTTLSNNDELSDTTVNDKMISFPKLVGLSSVTSYQMKINGTNVPDEEIDCTGDAIEGYMQYARWAGGWFSNAFGGAELPVGLESYNGTSFLMVIDFRNNHANVLNNFSTAQNNLSMLFKLRFSGAPPAGTNLNHFISYSRVSTFTPDGGVQTRS